MQRTSHTLADLYQADETAWLERTADLLRSRRLDQIDPNTLAEYLTDMARRDRREVFSRLVVLLTHLLKWEYQPARRSASWRATIREQRWELQHLLESGILREHALAIGDDAYEKAREQAADEMDTGVETFPSANPWTLEEAIDGPELPRP